MQRPLAGGSGVRGIASHIHPHFASELPHQQHLRRGLQGGDGANERAMLDARGSSTQSGHAWSPRWPRKRRRTGRARKEGANAGRARAAVPRRPAVEQCAGACLLPWVSSGHGRRGSKCRCGLDPEGSLDFRRQAVGRRGGDLGWGSRHVKTRERTVKPEASGSGQLRGESCHLGERTSKWLPTTEGASAARSHGEADRTPRLLDDGVGSCGQPERVLRVCRDVAGNITGGYRLG